MQFNFFLVAAVAALVPLFMVQFGTIQKYLVPPG
jgi:hypothetical protein